MMDLYERTSNAVTAERRLPVAAGYVKIEPAHNLHIGKAANGYGVIHLLYLYHYFEKAAGAFNNLSELPIEEAAEIQGRLTGVFAAQRNSGYLHRRRYLEERVKELFIAKGGKPERKTPYYMVVEECPWLETWYKEAAHIRIPISEFCLEALSFTYGDSFPTFSDKVNDGLEYRKMVYTYDEILKIIDKYGLPQKNWANPVFAQPAYVEVQVWSDSPIERYR